MEYSTLKTAVTNWTHRDDLTSVIDTLIDLFEARANRNIRTPEMENRAYATPTDEYLAFPDDYLELRNIQINDSVPYQLEYTTPKHIDSLGLSSGSPVYFTIVGNEFQIAPSASGKEVEISYYQTIPALSDSNTTNWLITKYPDYYLFGVLQQVHIYTMEPDGYEQRLQMMEADINRRGKAKKYGDSPLTVVAV